MRIKNLSSRHLHISLSDFERDPNELRTTLAVPDVLVRRKGEPYSVTGRIAQKSSLTICLGFPGGVPWDDVFGALVADLGGMDELDRLLRLVSAKDQHIHFQLPVRGASFQENNYLSQATLDALRHLRLWIGFDFSDFDPTDATHLDPDMCENSGSAYSGTSSS